MRSVIFTSGLLFGLHGLAFHAGSKLKEDSYTDLTKLDPTKVGLAGFALGTIGNMIRTELFWLQPQYASNLDAMARRAGQLSLGESLAQKLPSSLALKFSWLPTARYLLGPAIAGGLMANSLLFAAKKGYEFNSNADTQMDERVTIKA